MFYNSAQKGEIQELKTPKELFNILIQPDRRGDFPFWWEIMEGIEYYFNYNEYNNKHFQKYVFKDEDLAFLTELGVDFNHRDRGGQAFINYIYGLSKGGKVKDLTIWDEVKLHLAKQTKDFDKNDNWNRNVLFDLMTYQDGGVNGEILFKILEDFPKLDLYAVDNQGRNLLFHAIMNPAPFNVINFLIDSKVNLNQIDKDGYSLLHMFHFMSVSKESKPIFEVIFESLDNIGLRNKYGDNFFDSILLGMTDLKAQTHIFKRDIEWFELISDKIIKGEFKKTIECIDSLEKSMTKYSEQDLIKLSQENKLKYKEVLVSLNYFKLKSEFVEENLSGKESRKLKI